MGDFNIYNVYFNNKISLLGNPSNETDNVCELYYVLEGKLLINIDNCDLKIESGNFFYKDKSVKIRRETVTEGTSFYLIKFDSENYKISKTPYFKSKVKDRSFYKKILDKIYYADTILEQNSGASFIIEDVLNDFFALKKQVNSMDDAIAIIENLECVVDLKSLANSCYLSVGSFIRLFKEKVGQTPKQYRKTIQIKKAKELLIYTNLSLNDIMTQIGWYDASHFTHAFKQTVGYAPKEYRGLINRKEIVNLTQIWVKSNLEYNYLVAFQVKVPEGECNLKLSASNVFQVYFGDKLIGVGPRRSAKGYSLLNEYKLYSNGEFLTIFVGCYGNESFCHIKELPFFACTLQGEDFAFDSMDFSAYLINEKISRVVRYSYQRNFVEAYLHNNNPKNYLLNGFDKDKLEVVKVSNNIILNTTLPYPKLKEDNLACIIEEGKLNIYQNNYYPETFWQLKKGFYFEDEIYDVDLIREVFNLQYIANCIDKENYYKLYDFNINNSGYINLEFTAETDCTIYLLFDEILWQEEYEKANETLKNLYQNALPLFFWRMGMVNIINYKVKKGSYNFITLEPYTFRYLKVCVLGEGVVNKIERITITNSQVDNFKFVTQDKKINDIVDSALNTFAQNCIDILTDCPSRERAGWLCDSYFIARVEKLVTGQSLVEHNFLSNYFLFANDGKLPEGMIPMCYPSDVQNGMFIPNWAMWFILQVEDYYNRTLNKSYVEKIQSKIYGIIKYFSKFENELGLLEDLKGWVFVEWSQCNNYINGINVPTNMLYYKTLITVYNLYKDKSLLLKADKIKNTIQKYAFNGSFFAEQIVRINGQYVCGDVISETCQYYAFVMEIADKQTYSPLFNKMFFNLQDTISKNNMLKSNAFVGKYFRFELLNEYGYQKQILKECTDELYFMSNRTGTLWENLSVTGSLCHGFASYAIKWIVNAITGAKVDYINKVIYIKENHEKFYLKMPIENDFLIIEDGKLKQYPIDFKIVNT